MVRIVAVQRFRTTQKRKGPRAEIPPVILKSEREGSETFSLHFLLLRASEETRAAGEAFIRDKALNGIRSGNRGMTNMRTRKLDDSAFLFDLVKEN